MRHRQRGRKLGRTSSHRRAMLRNLASSLILTERDSEFEDNGPKVKGRVITTLCKAKEVRPLVEKCITLARRSLEHEEQAEQFATEAERGSAEWRRWRQSDEWQQWCRARAPVVAARRRALQLLGDKQAVEILFDEIAPRFAERSGGYTRVLRLAKPRLGDAGQRAILELVGVHDRVTVRSEKPAFTDDGPSGPADDEPLDTPPPAENSASEPPSEPDQKAGDEEVSDDTR